MLKILYRCKPPFKIEKGIPGICDAPKSDYF